MRIAVRPFLLACKITFALLVFSSQHTFAEAAKPTAGELVFQQGKLLSGAPLLGKRDAGVLVEGESAACINCHRRSGLGSFAGQIKIPPIIGKYLFRSADENAKDIGVPHVMIGAVIDKSSTESYTDATVARAIREGIGRGGRKLNYLMPRFKMDDATMASLIAYLKTLSNAPIPGVSDDTLHFATIITPDADPVVRQGMLDVIDHFVADKNSFIRGGSRPMKNAKGIEYRVTRRWQLHIWELTGASDTWEQQLRERLAAEPVFAVISGLGGKNWQPIHDFCGREKIPCLFPNVDDPIVNENDFYPIYYSKGVTLEAQLIAHQIQNTQTKPSSVVQIYRQGDIGEQGAKEAQTELESQKIKVANRVLKENATSEVFAEALKDIRADDTLLLWLRQEDLALLPAEVVASQAIYMSGLMAGLESAPLPEAWRKMVRMTYPFDLPEGRKVRMNYPLGWFKVKRIPVVAERVQSDTYLALGILSETLMGMLDSFQRDYLVERAEDMLSRRLITGYYPRLGLAPKQRFASKGGYLVRFAEDGGAKLIPESGWIVP
jgi:hypothetical protein